MKLLRNTILIVWATGIGLAQAGNNSGWTSRASASGMVLDPLRAHVTLTAKIAPSRSRLGKSPSYRGRHRQGALVAYHYFRWLRNDSSASARRIGKEAV